MALHEDKFGLGITLVILAIIILIGISILSGWWFWTSFLSVLGTVLIVLGLAGIIAKDVGPGLLIMCIGVTCLAVSVVACVISLVGVLAGIIGFIGVAFMIDDKNRA